MKQKTEIKDIFDGEFLNVWRDEGIFYLSTPFAALNFDQEMWEAFMKDMKKLVDL